jgi:hypothetical protein
MKSRSTKKDTRTRIKVLLRSGEVVKPGTLLILADDGTFIRSASQEYDALKFMAWSCDLIDLQGKPSQPIWAEIDGNASVVPPVNPFR